VGSSPVSRAHGYGGWECWQGDATGGVFIGADTEEAFAAFVENRSPGSTADREDYFPARCAPTMNVAITAGSEPRLCQR
jgi:hypothetical protein